MKEAILTREEIAVMRRLGVIARKFLRKAAKILKPGLSSRALEDAFSSHLSRYGVEPAFLGYASYPASLCVSLNDEVIHGIPSREKIMQEGDLVSVDLGIKTNDLFVDCAYTYTVGKGSSTARKLLAVGKEALRQGINKARAGNTVGDIGAVVQGVAERNGFSVVRQFVGHGIGRQLHCYPEVPNFGKPGTGPELKEGMAIAIEPMICAGGGGVEVEDDGWTVRTKDRSLSCHFEHTVVVGKRRALIVA